MVVSLTERQQQCLEGVLQHKTAKEIGRDLGISGHAVEQHLKSARRKLGADRTVDAARKYAAGVGKPASPYAITTEQPYYCLSELSAANQNDIVLSVPEPVGDPTSAQARNEEGLAYELTTLQTLAAIGLSALAIIAALALILSVAQGIDQLLS